MLFAIYLIAKMSATGNPIHSLEEQEVRKKGDFVNLAFACINFFIMLSASLSFINVIAFLITLALLSSILYALFLYYWKIRNNFFIIFNYGSTICTLLLYLDLNKWGSLYSDLYLIIIILQFLIFFIIIYFIYLLSLIKTLGTSNISRKIFITRYGSFQGYGQQRINQMWHDDAVDILNPRFPGTTFEEVAKFQDEQKKKYNVMKILLMTVILTISFLIIYIYAIIL